MSYIHEALKKAQVERDLGKGPYSGIPVPRRKKSFFTVKRILLLTASLLMVLLAFAGYSWWDQRTDDRGQRTEDRGSQNILENTAPLRVFFLLAPAEG